MSAYLIVQAIVTDPQRFSAYARRTAELVTAAGGEYLVLGARPEVLEGQWPAGVTVISRWPTIDDARAFWNSPAYTDAKRLREGCCIAHVALVAGTDEGSE